MNATLGEMLGYEPAEINSQPVNTILSSGARIFFQTHFFPILRLHGKAEEIYLSLLGKGGTAVPVLVNAVRHQFESGAVNDCIFVYMKERRHYEDALLLAKNEAERMAAQLLERDHFLQRMTEVTPGIIHVYDLEKQSSIFVNQNIALVLGYSPEEVEAMGENIVPTLMYPEDFARLPAHIERVRALRDNEIADFEYRMFGHTGHLHWFHSRDVVFARDAVGAVSQFISIAIDITEQKNMENQMRQIANELSESDRRKDEFLATLAHELRNPLTPIRTGLELIKLAGDSREVVEQVRTMMNRQLTQMVRLIDDLMDVSRINTGKLELRKEQIELTAVLNSAIETCEPLITQMGHELTVTYPKIPLVVDADLTRLAQVFLNLLNNAAKYTQPYGHIKLSVELQGGYIEVSVRDNGIGISADHMPRIFELFTQVDQSLSKAQGGLGIGLSLVKKLIEMHAGMIEVKSDGPGKGSEFVVRLPIVLQASWAEEVIQDEVAIPNSSLCILIVDDNKDAADSLSMMLNIAGYDTHAAYDGQEGMDVAKELQPDVLLLDIGMPKLNGYEVCRQIRGQSWGKETLVIATTGWGQDKDRRLSQEAGFDHHMVKPIDTASLMKILKEL